MTLASINPPLDFDNALSDAMSQVALLLGLADARQTEDHEAEFWTGVFGVLKEIYKHLETMRDLETAQSNRLWHYEHPDDERSIHHARGKRRRSTARKVGRRQGGGR